MPCRHACLQFASLLRILISFIRVSLFLRRFFARTTTSSIGFAHSSIHPILCNFRSFKMRIFLRIFSFVDFWWARTWLVFNYSFYVCTAKTIIDQRLLAHHYFPWRSLFTNKLTQIDVCGCVPYSTFMVVQDCMMVFIKCEIKQFVSIDYYLLLLNCVYVSNFIENYMCLYAAINAFSFLLVLFTSDSNKYHVYDWMRF